WGTTNLTAIGTGNAVLIGGKGTNTLTNNDTGFNLLIGGAGTAPIIGNRNDNLVRGTTRSDGRVTAPQAVLSVWGHTNVSDGDRTARIFGTEPGSTYRLNRTTVQQSTAKQPNTLTDGANQPQDFNWFLYFTGDTVSAKASETTTQIS